MYKKQLRDDDEGDSGSTRRLDFVATSAPRKSDTTAPFLLIVDDEARSARMLGRMLREDGYDVEVLVDGADAVARLSVDPLPDVLLTDISMPHVDGNAVAQYARSRNGSIPVVFVTSHPNLLHGDGLSSPSTVHVKPIDYGRLRRQIESLWRDALLLLRPAPAALLG